jgi:type II secretory pathway pseudopilin PulG
MNMKTSGFTLIEFIIIIAIASSLIALSVVGGMRFKDSLEYNLSVNQVLSDIKLTQQLAQTTSQACRIEFRAGKNSYTIIKGGSHYKAGMAGKKIQFYGKSYFSFVPSGCTDVGGSGTLSIGGVPKVKKIIVSSKGRIRIE